MRTETCCEVVTNNNNNKTYCCDCWCIVLSDSYVFFIILKLFSEVQVRAKYFSLFK
jgi:hypothetical protein